MGGGEEANPQSAGRMPVDCPGRWSCHWKSGVYVRKAPAPHLFVQRGGGGGRAGADEIYLHRLFPLRHDGLHGGVAARRWQVGRADDRFPRGGLRPAAHLDCHGIPDAPYHGHALYHVSGFLAHHVGRARDYVHVRLSEDKWEKVDCVRMMDVVHLYRGIKTAEV